MATLETPATIEAGFALRQAAFMTVLAAFDRKVEREFFLRTAYNAFNFGEGMRRAEVLNNVAACLADGTLTTTALKNTIEQFIQQAEAYRAALVGQAHLLAEMPQNGETVQ